MNNPDLQKQVRDFLILKTRVKVREEGEDCALLGAGLMDSFGLVSLLAEVESKFGVFPDLMNHDPRDYSTLSGLTRIILQSLGVAVATTIPDLSVSTDPELSRIQRLSVSHPLWPSLPDLFKEMFDHFAITGLKVPLVQGGEHLWLKSIENFPEQAYFVAGAIHENELQGFITAQMKILPNFLGGRWIGDVTYLYVRPAARRMGFATELTNAAMHWLQERGAASVELQVLSQNTGAHAFWLRQEFDPELVQFRRPFVGSGQSSITP